MTASLILASGSPARAVMLEKAGLTFRRIPADVDESAIRKKMAAGTPPEKIARALALAKAEHVSVNNTEAVVIGGDQLLVFGGHIFEKPGSRAGLRKQLRTLRGKTHTLISAVCLMKGGKCLWSYGDQAHLFMRDFSDAFLEEYMESVGRDVYSCVGGYQLEGVGAQLFDKIDGDYFAVLGLPLLPLLRVLREHDILLV